MTRGFGTRQRLASLKSNHPEPPNSELTACLVIFRFLSPFCSPVCHPLLGIPESLLIASSREYNASAEAIIRQ